jgi:hypothetical protein
VGEWKGTFNTFKTFKILSILPLFPKRTPLYLNCNLFLCHIIHPFYFLVHTPLQLYPPFHLPDPCKMDQFLLQSVAEKKRPYEKRKRTPSRQLPREPRGLSLHKCGCGVVFKLKCEKYDDYVDECLQGEYEILE